MAVPLTEWQRQGFLGIHAGTFCCSLQDGLISTFDTAKSWRENLKKSLAASDRRMPASMPGRSGGSKEETWLTIC
ncbi:MAG TPA: hypothetical protein VHY35_21720 [Stellaceae bacterium]|nr:hypothetical protein [Stellaceae bacterium]